MAMGAIGPDDGQGKHKVNGRQRIRIVITEDGRNKRLQITADDGNQQVDGPFQQYQTQTPPPRQQQRGGAPQQRDNQQSVPAQQTPARESDAVMCQRLELTLNWAVKSSRAAWGDDAPYDVVGASANSLFIAAVRDRGCLLPLAAEPGQNGHAEQPPAGQAGQQAPPRAPTAAELAEAKRRAASAIQAAATRADLLRYRASYLRRGFVPADAAELDRLLGLRWPHASGTEAVPDGVQVGGGRAAERGAAGPVY